MARREVCRICGSSRLSRFLDLGPSPLANRLLKRVDEAEPTFPLDVFVCRDCWLAQLLEVVDPEVLFRDYLYVSGTSETMRAHFAAFAESLAQRFSLGAGDLVVEVASNDGTFLANFQPRGDLRLLGVEPATNIAAIARARGIETINEFFSPEIGAQIARQHGPAKCIIANNVFAHLDDMHGFVEGVLSLLAGDGVFVFENSYVRDMLEHLEFDSVYHEHLSYFSVTALTVLFERHGMEILDVQRQPVHGGSLRVFVQRRGCARPVTDAPARFRAKEQRDGFCELPTYAAFAERVYTLRHTLVELLRGLRRDGKRVVAYGASAKGNTLLNFMGIGAGLVEYIVDKSELKQGTFSPGMHLPVLPVRRLVEDRPDYALLLAWNFTDEVVAQQREYVDAGGRFIVPIPEPRIVP